MARRRLPVVYLLFLFLVSSIDRSEGNTIQTDNDQGKVLHSVDDKGKETGLVTTEETLRVGYKLLWDKNSIRTYDFNDDLESVNCTKDSQCEACLQNLDIALMQQSSLPTSPFCSLHSTENGTNTIGRCTCGAGRCVSYSRDSSLGVPYYYCGPCGWVGARCVESNCTHRQAECRNNYCECIQGGLFYDLNYCYYPYFGKNVMLEMLVSTAIVLVMCAILAYAYSKIGRRREQGDFSTLRWRQNSTTRESPASDTPPSYDDVVDKLPSYQDAVKMNPEDKESTGMSNPAFENEYPLPPPSYEEIKQSKETHSSTEKTDGVKNTGDKVDNEAQNSDSSSVDDPVQEIHIQPIELALQNAMQDLQGKDLN